MFAVTSYPPPANGIRTLQLTEHEDRISARGEAERVLLLGHTEVRVWKLLDQPMIVKSVTWNDTTP